MTSNRFALCLFGIMIIAGCQRSASQPPIGSRDSTVAVDARETASDTSASDTAADPESVANGASDPEPVSTQASDSVATDQNWTEEDQNWFYGTSQGSQLIDYKWMLALEQPNNRDRFLADDYMDSLGFIPREFDPEAPNQPDHLPVGFAKDGTLNWLGLTCAACHTTELDYDGQQIRIDGGGAFADVGLMLTNLTAAIENTVNDVDGKLERFTDRVLHDDHGEEAELALEEKLHAYLLVRQDYDKQNSSPLKEGFARLDAFGRIYNKALSEVNAGPDNFNPPDAPVSFPFLWGTDQSDYVQWVGNAGNSNVGRLARNMGEVLGVFAHVNIAHRHFYTIGYPSSATSFNQIELEQKLRKLKSPVWPAILPKIDVASAARGATLFVNNCAECHNLVDRADEDRKVIAWMENLDSIKTDRKTAENIVNRTGKTGLLNGRKAFLLFGPEFGDTASVLSIVTNEVAGMLLQRAGDDILDELISLYEGRGAGDPDKHGNYEHDTKDNPNQSLLAYKGRSLCGVWATAPYLHNGSVPSLWQLLAKPDERVKTFFVGNRKFDPKEVGLAYKEESPGYFEFRTHDEAGAPIPGNSNAGHEFGTELTDAEKWDLIEFMKTEMGPVK